VLIIDSSGEEAIDLTLIQRAEGSSYHTISALDFETKDVFIIARKVNSMSRTFRMAFDIEFVEKYPLSGGAIFAIVFFVLIAFAGLVLAVILILNRQGIIEIYLPK